MLHELLIPDTGLKKNKIIFEPIITMSFNDGKYPFKKGGRDYC